MDQLDVEQIGRVFRWQTMFGLTTPVANCAALSVRGPRGGVPTVFSPDNYRWPALADVRKRITEIQTYIRGARQIAPVALLWPIRSFYLKKMAFPDPANPLRVDFVSLLEACLDHQVGTHIIDEAAVWELQMHGNEAVLGNARYTHLLVPSCIVLHADTIAALQRLQQQGITVIFAGRMPDWIEEPMALAPADIDWCPRLSPQEAVAQLPRLLPLQESAAEIRCTAWESQEGHITRLLMNIRQTRWEDGACILEPGQLIVI